MSEFRGGRGSRLEALAIEVNLVTERETSRYFGPSVEKFNGRFSIRHMMLNASSNRNTATFELGDLKTGTKKKKENMSHRRGRDVKKGLHLNLEYISTSS